MDFDYQEKLILKELVYKEICNTNTIYSLTILQKLEQKLKRPL